MAWYNTNWKYRKKITINKTYTTTSLTDFNFYLKLKDGSIAESSLSNANDIIFTKADGVTLLSHEIISFNRGFAELLANIKTDVSSSADTEIYIYYGNNSAVNTSNKITTNSKFDLLSHMAFEPTDSTINLDVPNDTITKLGTWVYGQRTPFSNPYLGSSIKFNAGSSDYLRKETGLNTGTPNTFSAEAWIKIPATTDCVFLSQGSSTGDTTQDFQLLMVGNKLSARLKTNTTNSTIKSGTTNISINTLHHIAFIWKADTSQLKLFLDGNLEGSFTIGGAYVDFYYQRTVAAKLFIGVMQSGATYYYGELSEIKISTNSTYTENYIKTNYKNIKENLFWSISTSEVNPDIVSSIGWRQDYSNYLKKLKVFIKKEEIIGTEKQHRFPFLLNLYNPCLNEASAYGNDIVITDKYGEMLPFERILFRKNINQQRYSGSYKVDLVGLASLIYDVNAEGAYRAGYLANAGNYIRFNEVQILNLGIHNLNIRYSNGSGGSLVSDVVVNNTSYSITFPSTSSYNIYSTISIPIVWSQQWNIVEIGKTTTAPDIDWIQPIEQETAQLKGFVLLPELEFTGIDTEIDIYFKNTSAPIRLNSAYGAAEILYQAEALTLSNMYVEYNAIYLNGQGVRLNNYLNPGYTSTTFSGTSGYYDVSLEVIADEEANSDYEIFINGISKAIFTSKPMVGVSLSRINFVKQKILITNGQSISIKSTSNNLFCFARLGSIRLTPSIFDPNENWNSEEVWGEYEAVWHLDGSPEAEIERPFFDYSGNERHIFAYGMSGVNKINSSIGAGIFFTGNLDRLYGQFSSMTLEDDDFTISSWIQRSPIANSNKGILISNAINWRFETYTRMRMMFGDSDAAEGQYVTGNIPDKFEYHSFAYDIFSKERESRISGTTVKTITVTENYTDINDRIAIGISRNMETGLRNSDTESFDGLLAEIRIRKDKLTQNWQKNENKNLQYPQQYINYSTTQCNDQILDVIATVNIASIITTTNLIKGNLHFIRINTVLVNTTTNLIKGNLHFIRNMFGSIIFSGSALKTLILYRVSTGLISTSSIIGKNWIIEFIRFFTGGILSGDANTIIVVDFFPNEVGSISFGSINTSYAIDDGFTVIIVFNDAIGGSGIIGGALVNNITIFIDNISSGFSWTSGIIYNSVVYNIINNTGILHVFGIALFIIDRIFITDFACIIITSNNIIKVVYNIINNTGSIYTSGTVVKNNIYNIINNTGSIYTSGTVVRNNIYNIINNTGSIYTSGIIVRNNIYNIVNNTGSIYTSGTIVRNNIYYVINNTGILHTFIDNIHKVIYCPIVLGILHVSGTAVRYNIYNIINNTGILHTSGTIVRNNIYNITNNTGSIYTSGTIVRNNIYNIVNNTGILYTFIDNIHKVIYCPIVLGILHITGTVVRNNIYNIINNTGGFIITTTTSSTSIDEGWTLKITYTDNTGSIYTSGTVVREVVYNIINNTGILHVFTNTIIYNIYDIINNTGILYTSGTVVRNNIYNITNNTGYIYTAGTIVRNNIYNITNNTGSIYTSGTIVRNNIYYVINNTGILHVIGTVVREVVYNIINNTGSAYTSGTAVRYNIYCITNNTGILHTSGTSPYKIYYKTVIIIPEFILTSGVNYPEVNYNVVNNTGNVFLIDTVIAIVTTHYIPILYYGIVIAQGTSLPTINIYIPEASVYIMQLSSSVVRNNIYSYIPDYPIANFYGNSSYDSTLDCYFDNSIDIKLYGNTWDRQTIYIENFNGGIKTLEGSIVIVFDSTLIPYNKCVRGRVNTTNDLPSEMNSQIGWIYYVVNHSLYHWWEHKPSGNYEQRSDPYFNTGVHGVYNFVSDLPTVGNTIGDVWQIGRCHDGIYYVWTGSNWIEDENYPPVVKVVMVSIGVVKLSGTVSIEANYISEISGTILIYGTFTINSDYDSSLSVTYGSLYTYGTYYNFIINRIYTGSGIINLSCYNTIPEITRNYASSIYLESSGSAIIKVDYIELVSIISINLSGTILIKANLIFYLSTDRLIVLQGLDPSTIVDREYIPSGIVLASSSITADLVLYNTNCILSIIQLGSSGIEKIFYEVDNDFAKIIVSNITPTIKLIYKINPVGYCLLGGNATNIKVNYIKTIILGLITCNIIKKIIVDYYANTSGKIIWRKYVTAGICIITDQLLATFIPSGEINIFGYYLTFNCVYINTNITGKITISNSVYPQIIFSNPDYYSGLVITDSITILALVDYFKETTGNIEISGNFIVYNLYKASYEVNTIKINNTDTENIIVYIKQTSGVIFVRSDSYVPLVNYIINTYGIIILNNLNISITEYNGQIILNSIKIYSSFIYTIVYKPYISIIRLIISMGTSAPNNYSVKIKSFGKINLSGTILISNSFIGSIINPRIRILGSSLIKANYLKTSQGFIKINNTNTYHRFVISRIPVLSINLNGTALKLSVYIYKIINDKIILSGNAFCLYYKKFKYYGGGLIRLSGTRISGYIPLFEKIVTGLIRLSGGSDNPTEYILSIYGIINVRGFALVKVRYYNIVNIETIKLSLTSGALALEYNKYTGISIVVAIKLSGTFEKTYRKTYLGNIITKSIKLSGYGITNYIPKFKYSGFGVINVNILFVYKAFSNYISSIEVNTIILSNIEKIFYPSYGNFIVFGGIIISGININIIDCIYKPISAGIIWDKGSAVYGENEYININSLGIIKLGGKSSVSIKKIFYYTATTSHLGSIKIWGESIHIPVFIFKVTTTKIIVSNPLNIIFKVEYIKKAIAPTKIVLSGNANKTINFVYVNKGIIIISGTSLIKITYNLLISSIGQILLSGSAIALLFIYRTMSGTILINGIARGNTIIVPIISGWIIVSGGNGFADIVDYGEASIIISSIIIIGNFYYRTHGEEDLIFHEITHRREYEGALESSGITYPEEAWSSLQNFNDLLEID